MFLIWLKEKLNKNFLSKVISLECKCKFNGRKCNSNQKWNSDKCQCECENHHVFEKD